MKEIRQYRRQHGIMDRYNREDDPIERWIGLHKNLIAYFMHEFQKQEEEEAKRIGNIIVEEIQDGLRD